RSSDLDLLLDFLALADREPLAARHPVAEAHRDRRQPSAHLGHRFDRRRANQIPDHGETLGEIAAFDLAHFDGHRLARSAKPAGSAESSTRPAESAAAPLAALSATRSRRLSSSA